MKITSELRFQSKAAYRIAFFSHQSYWTNSFNMACSQNQDVEIKYFTETLTPATAILATSCNIVCCFVNDILSQDTLMLLEQCGVRMIVMRCAGTDNINLDGVKDFKMELTHVPAYSPYAVAEHAITLLMVLNRKLHKAYNKTRNGDFSLDGLVGFDLFGKTVGVLGTGRIGACFINILGGFGCKVLAYDVVKNKDVENLPFVQYASQEEIYKNADVISLHVPLLPSTKHLVNKSTLSQMKRGVVIINTSRGGLIETSDLLAALKSGQVGAAGLDVYEGEKEFFFHNRSSEVLQDEILLQLTSMNNVVVTSHMAFLTQEALDNIAKSVLASVSEFIQGKKLGELKNSVIKNYGLNKL